MVEGRLPVQVPQSRVLGPDSPARPGQNPDEPQTQRRGRRYRLGDTRTQAARWQSAGERTGNRKSPIGEDTEMEVLLPKGHHLLAYDSEMRLWRPVRLVRHFFTSQVTSIGYVVDFRLRFDENRKKCIIR